MIMIISVMKKIIVLVKYDDDKTDTCLGEVACYQPETVTPPPLSIIMMIAMMMLMATH